MKESVNSKIIEFLKQKQAWVWGGQIEDHIRASLGAKASNASRVCRNLENEGILERRLQTYPGEARKFVQYRIRQQGYVPPQTDGNCCYSYKIFKIHAQDCQENKKQETVAQGLF